MEQTKDEKDKNIERLEIEQDDLKLKLIQMAPAVDAILVKQARIQGGTAAGRAKGIAKEPSRTKKILKGAGHLGKMVMEGNLRATNPERRQPFIQSEATPVVLPEEDISSRTVRMGRPVEPTIPTAEDTNLPFGDEPLLREEPITLEERVEIEAALDRNEQAPTNNLDTEEPDSTIGDMERRPRTEGEDVVIPPRDHAEMPVDVADILSQANKGFWGKMSEKAKGVAKKAYEGVGADVITGKLGIAYNNMWANRHQEKAVTQKNKMGGLDVQIGALDQAKQEIESVVQDLRQQGMPGAESLQIKLKVLDAQRAELLGKKDKSQSKLEARDNKSKLYVNKRDQIADRFIERYDKKLAPMEASLDRLETARNEVNLLAAVMTAKNNEQLRKLGNIENRKRKIEEALRRAGTSEVEIRKFAAVKELDKLIANGKEDISKKKADMEKKRAAIDKKVAKADAKANPYRDKREKFVRVKENRPIKIETEERERSTVFTGKEETSSHPRSERVENVFAGFAQDRRGPARGRDSTRYDSPIESEERRQTVSDFIEEWNETIREKDPDYHVFVINEEEFIREVRLSGVRLSGGEALDKTDFKKVIEMYCKFKKWPWNRMFR